jgi:hypothetical protein
VLAVSETRQIGLVVGITVLMAVMALAFFSAGPLLPSGGLAVDEYEAVWYENGTLVERYTYNVPASGQYRMLFRTWDFTLALEPLDQPHIEFVGMTAPEGTVGYARDYAGRVAVADPADAGQLPAIADLALPNEVGI